MSKIDLQVTIGGESSSKEDTFEIISNLNRDLDTLDDRIQRLNEEGIDLQLKVETGEVVATLKEN